MKKLNIIDVYTIRKPDCPVFVQSSDMKSFFGFAIRRRTRSSWQHSMIMRLPGKLVSQSITYKEIDIEKYMGRGQIMKFWICDDIKDHERNAILIKIQHELSQPWHKKMYDWPGIAGHFFGLRWFNIPSLNYCSERVSSKIKCILPEIKKHPTPEDIDHLFKNSERMRVLGYYLAD